MGSNSPPDFLERLNSQNARQGETVSFTVVTKGSPVPVVRWFREGMEIQSGGDFLISADGNTHTLQISNPYPEDTGVFTVTATNPSGKEIVQIFFYFYRKYFFIQIFEQKTIFSLKINKNQILT